MWTKVPNIVIKLLTPVAVRTLNEFPCKPTPTAYKNSSNIIAGKSADVINRIEYCSPERERVHRAEWIMRTITPTLLARRRRVGNDHCGRFREWLQRNGMISLEESWRLLHCTSLTTIIERFLRSMANRNWFLERVNLPDYSFQLTQYLIIHSESNEILEICNAFESQNRVFNYL